MPPPIVIDTNAFRDRDFRYWLLSYRGEKVLPMVAFVEFAFFLQSRGKTYEQVMGLVGRFRVQIQPFGQVHAKRAIETSIKVGDFSKNWRDHMIAGHAHTAPTVLVTYNVDDFAFLGHRAMTPQQAMKEL